MRNPGPAVQADRFVSAPSGPRAPVSTGAAVSRSLRIVFLVRSLGYGGAERQLVVLASALRDRGHVVSVLTFYPGGELESDLRTADVRVRSLEKRGRWDVATFLPKLHRVVREESPDVLHSYLVDPNIVAAVLRPLLPGVRVVWGERSSNMDLSHYDWVSRLSSRMARALCRMPDLVILNSRAGLEHAAACGYPREKMAVIPNGIDVERFAPDAAAGHRVRHEWRVSTTERLIGLVGRLDPVKDHPTFLRAAAQLARENSDARFVCVGDGDAQYRQALQQLAGALGIADLVRWVGARPDMPAVYNAFDIACLSSASEGFPNVLAEAMACGVPCVATDVGDAAWLLARPESVAPPKDPRALAERMRSLLTRDLEAAAIVRGAARERIVTQFSVASLVSNTERALAGLLAGESV